MMKSKCWNLGVLCNINGNGRLDFIAGEDWRCPYIWWWKQPVIITKKWRKYLIGIFANKFHTQLWADVDGEGNPELVAGNYRFKPMNDVGKEWQRFHFAQGYVGTLVGVAWFKVEHDPHELWQEHILANDLFDPHSLIIADFTSNGLPDICVIEMNFIENPQVILFINRGNGKFETHVVDEGVGSHDAKLIHINGRPAIVGKSFTGKYLGEVHIWIPKWEH